MKNNLLHKIKQFKKILIKNIFHNEPSLGFNYVTSSTGEGNHFYHNKASKAKLILNADSYLSNKFTKKISIIFIAN